MQSRSQPVHLTPHPIDQDLDLLEKAADHTMNVTTSAADVLDANKYRCGATFINNSDTVIYARLGQDAAVNTGIRLNANGGSFEINKTNMFKGRVSAIHGGSGNKVLCIQEWETRYAY